MARFIKAQIEIELFEVALLNAHKVQQAISIKLFVHFNILWAAGLSNKSPNSISNFLTGSIKTSKFKVQIPGAILNEHNF